MTPAEFKLFLEAHDSLCLDSEEDRLRLLAAYTETFESTPTVLVLVDLDQVCSGCPTAFEAKTEDGHDFYARYRWGNWYMTLTDKDTGEEKTLAEGSTGNDWGGMCSWEELLAWAADQVTIAVRSWVRDFRQEEDYDTEALFSQLIEKEKGGSDVE